MKKTINVNMFGMLFTIDEDAYSLLSNYLGSLQKYFRSRPGGAEIVSDIEGRVAELMNELVMAGTLSISVSDIESIISRIGSPEDLDASAPADFSDSGNASPGIARTRKKLFRCTEGKMVAGVFAGLGQYFGVNPVWLRLIAIVLVLLPFHFVVLTVPLAVLAYLVAWGCIPAAETPIQMLEMKGEPVNMETITASILDSASRIKSSISSRRGFFSRLVDLVGAVIRAFLFIALVAVIVLAAVGVAFAFFLFIQALLAFSGSSLVLDEYLTAFLAASSVPVVVTAFVSALVGFAIVIFLAFYSILLVIGRRSSMPSWAVIASLVVLGVSGAVFFSTFVPLYAAFDREADERSYANFKQMDIEKRTRSVNALAALGWTLAEGENVHVPFINEGEHYSGNSDKHYLEFFESDGPMTVRVERSAKVAPGVYSLEAFARTDGDGVLVYAATSSSSWSADVPAFSDKGGQVWEDAVAALADSTLSAGRQARLQAYAGVNDDSGFGWSRVTIPSVVVGADSLVTYGITNIHPLTGWNGSWFSATEFHLAPAR